MKTYELPDGNSISKGNVPFCYPEDPLQPRFISRKASEIYHTSFMKCDVDMCKDLYAWQITSICTKIVKFLQNLLAVPRVTPSPSESL